MWFQSACVRFCNQAHVELYTCACMCVVVVDGFDDSCNTVMFIQPCVCQPETREIGPLDCTTATLYITPYISTERVR
jgi:hypothetical protein